MVLHHRDGGVSDVPLFGRQSSVQIVAELLGELFDNNCTVGDLLAVYLDKGKLAFFWAIFHFMVHILKQTQLSANKEKLDGPPFQTIITYPNVSFFTRVLSRSCRFSSKSKLPNLGDLLLSSWWTAYGLYIKFEGFYNARGTDEDPFCTFREELIH